MTTLSRYSVCAFLVLATLAVGPANALAQNNPYLGRWALTLPDGRAGWLGVERKDSQLQAAVLWGGGSVVPVASAVIEDGKLVVTRTQRSRRGGGQSVEIITGTVDGDNMSLTTQRKRGEQVISEPAEFTGKRIPKLPPAPKLSQVKFGPWVDLFNGSDLSGWSVMNPNSPNGWRAEDGVMINEVKQEEGRHVSHANLRTDRDFEDFNIAMDVRVQEGGNSGVYLRGIYEVQVSESFGRGVDSHNMGAVYSRITPTAAAEKPAGQWQTLDITLVDRHVTVILNGKTIIDNQPVLGCTGGAMWSDEFRPGPIYLQGDHTSVDYRNIRIRTVAK